MVLSTAIPTLIAATVIVIISSGIPRSPNKPITEKATKIFGTKPIAIILNDLNIKRSIKAITPNTNNNEPSLSLSSSSHTTIPPFATTTTMTNNDQHQPVSLSRLLNNVSPSRFGPSSTNNNTNSIIGAGNNNLSANNCGIKQSGGVAVNVGNGIGPAIGNLNSLF